MSQQATTAVAAPSGSIMDLIGLLGKLGANLPAFMAFAQTVIVAWQNLQNAINPAKVGKLMAVALTAEEAQAIDSLHKQLTPGLPLMALPGTVGGHPAMALGDGRIFGGIFAFAKAHPMLKQILIQIAQGMLTGGIAGI